MVPALEHGPERLNPVGMRHAVHILTDAVLHGFMLERHTLISAVIVRIDGRALGGAIADETLKRLGVRSLDHDGANAVRLAVLGTNYNSLSNGATTRPELLVSVLVLFLATDEGFVDLNRTREERPRSLHDSLIRCARCQAVFWVMPRSR